jgi:cytoskeletal protein CcmA (bactofilin family)
MALSSFGRGRDGNESIPAPRPAPVAGPSGLTAFIDQGSEFEGKLSFRDTVRIDGRFQGEISSENTLIVGESGEIEATIRSNTVVVSGSVNGSIHAIQKVVLHKTAHVSGDIETPSISIEEGAVLNGQIKMPAKTSAKAGAASLKAVGGGAAAEPSKPKS